MSSCELAQDLKHSLMSIQPIDLPSLLKAVSWPAIAAVALALFRRPLANVFSALGQKVSKFSIGGFSIEMAQVQEMKPSAMDTEIRQLQAGLVPQSGSTSLTELVNELQSGGQHDYVVIDFGSETSPRWLTSRLYLLCFLIMLINRQLCIVFVETIGNVRKNLIGMASPGQVRWALAYRYGWLESAAAGAYASQTANPPAGYLPAPTQANQFAPSTGYYWAMIPNVIQQFLTAIRSAIPPLDQDKSEWVSLDNQQTHEHAKWLNGARLENLLGSDLSTAHVTLLPNQTLNDVVNPVLSQQGRFIAVVEPDQSFSLLVDRLEVLDGIARELLKKNSPSKT
jgi:hypothetical protein